MKTIALQLEDAFRAAIQTAFGFESDPLLAPAQNEKFGDYQANAAMGLAKQLEERTGRKIAPRAVAEQIRANLKLDDIASELSIAGPGFINVRLSPQWLARQLNSMAGDARLGVEPVAAPQTVVIDYSGPNIAKELHVGHLRSTIIGDACSRVIDFQGHQVIRQNHLGDWGTQFGMLIANLQDKHESAGDTKLSDLEAFYVEAKKRFDADPAFQTRARENVVKLQSGDPPTVALWRLLVEKTREHYLPIYQRLGVQLKPDDERGESFYNDLLATVVDELKLAQVATISDGATVVFIEGHESPLIIEKTGGGYLYGTTDLAAVRYRAWDLKADRIIYFVDARQSQHFAQVFAAARKAGWAEGVLLEHAAFGTMLGPDGRPFRTKAGDVVKLKKLLDDAEEKAAALAVELAARREAALSDAQRDAVAHAVGIGGVKYADLSKDRTSDYTFSFDAMLALDGNTAPYLQYAHARVRSIFRKLEERAVTFTREASITLTSTFEVALGRQILRFGEVIELVGRELKPHHLCAYLYELAGRFSGFFENCPVIQSEEPTRSSRLALVELTAKTLALGLELLGIEHPDQM